MSRTGPDGLLVRHQILQNGTPRAFGFFNDRFISIVPSAWWCANPRWRFLSQGQHRSVSPTVFALVAWRSHLCTVSGKHEQATNKAYPALLRIDVWSSLSVAQCDKYSARQWQTQFGAVQQMLCHCTPPPNCPLCTTTVSPAGGSAYDSPLPGCFSCRPRTHRLGSRRLPSVSDCVGPPDWLRSIRTFSRPEGYRSGIEDLPCTITELASWVR